MAAECTHGHPLCPHGRCSARCCDCTEGFGPEWWIDEDALDRWADDGGPVPDGEPG